MRKLQDVPLGIALILAVALVVVTDLHRQRGLVIESQSRVIESQSQVIQGLLAPEYLRVSAYSLDKRQCNDDLDHTAIMEKPTSGYTVAVSRDLQKWLGRDIYIEGLGLRRVADLMNKRYSLAVDVLMRAADAREFGVQHLKVTLIGGEYEISPDTKE